MKKPLYDWIKNPEVRRFFLYIFPKSFYTAFCSKMN